MGRKQYADRRRGLSEKGCHGSDVKEAGEQQRFDGDRPQEEPVGGPAEGPGPWLAPRYTNAFAVWASTTVAKAAPQAGASTAGLGIAPPGRQPAAASHALNAAILTSASTGPSSPKARCKSSWSMM